MRQKLVHILCCLFIPIALACTTLEEVATNLNAKQSIEMVVALNRSGVAASRESIGSGGNQLYRVVVNPGDISKALEVMHEYGLPRSIDETLEEITRPRGFVPNTPQLAQLRLDYALELRVEKAMLSLPGVVEAKVVVQSDSATSIFGAKSATRGVSVVLRFSDEVSAQATPLSQVQLLVSTAVPGVTPDKVEVRYSTAQIPVNILQQSNLVQLKPFSFRVPRAELGVAGIQILVMFAAFCFVGIIFGGFWTSRLEAKRRKRMRAVIASEGSRSMFLEASLQENPQTKASLPQVKDGGV